MLDGIEQEDAVTTGTVGQDMIGREIAAFRWLNWKRHYAVSQFGERRSRGLTGELSLIGGGLARPGWRKASLMSNMHPLVAQVPT